MERVSGLGVKHLGVRLKPMTLGNLPSYWSNVKVLIIVRNCVFTICKFLVLCNSPKHKGNPSTIKQHNNYSVNLYLRSWNQ